MDGHELLPNLFRTEYRKIIAVLCATFGIDHVEIAEDIVADTFLSATELWGTKGLPENPTAWLYTVAKNKTRNHLKRTSLFANTITPALRNDLPVSEEPSIDLTEERIRDSQLAMIFTVCDPRIPVEAQVALALNLLCGFGVQEVADAFLITREAAYKRLHRGKERLRSERIRIEQPEAHELDDRLPAVLTTLYLLFSEGYYSSSTNTILRKDLCGEAMRLAYLLVQNETTNLPVVNALLSLMCFHASRFDARFSANGDVVLYGDQDVGLWDMELVRMGEHFLNQASTGSNLSKYHLEAGIAYWHTHKDDTTEKWESILQLYNRLLQIEYSPVAALNRTYALAKANGYEQAIVEAEKLDLTANHLYHCLLGHLYVDIDRTMALHHFDIALSMTTSDMERQVIVQQMDAIVPTWNSPP
ncbi:MAG: RNA polymerase subunit sigma ['Candidatus Kapabacteria' thiocyanatum]|uniref:RNA polymerase subunit sigma n=1 Tax=Candidatus Kapaibacterium thiocyanatum TaxID=1895771 RepID=A0A1M3KZH1_9BACT|nr:RNA polymerase subunit sigma ['Candidatus Kapabacteria' thiocyanatum]OJX57988.1 MAG: RNA polymerase subunit sigma ['Candidatus Kapabacteria' thiocyanatum]